ncbi:MAG: uracil-DNA glycosylase [Ignavibacteriae bacterium HGW-Ignavibacteriae-4]|nr:MAG: uracil-DNA glycosylase [Ignavibacteriae bacterium HGW-Ignavibacteriae-4]
MRCELGATRNKFVFGTGDPNADLLIIGEAPGRDEDAQGEPFVGRSGKLLTTILESIQLSRDDVFIANILKCRPPNNRRPSTSEVDTCEVYLHKQIELINPKYILALGLTAADTLLKEKCVMKDIRGEILDYRGKKLMITYHPSALLRNPNLKRPVWEDMKKLKELLVN